MARTKTPPNKTVRGNTSAIKRPKGAAATPAKATLLRQAAEEAARVTELGRVATAARREFGIPAPPPQHHLTKAERRGAHWVLHTTRGYIRVPPPPTRRYRLRSGTKALREIRKLQKSTDLLIPKAPFQRLVREITYDMCSGLFREGSWKEKCMDARWSEEALEALQHAAEAHLVGLFKDAQLIACQSGKRKTIMPRDYQVARFLKG